jgi:hypothetical protein
VSDHSLPLHINVSAKRPALPTATQCFALGHDTAVSESPVSAVGVGVIDQDVGVGDSEAVANATIALDTTRLAASNRTRQHRRVVRMPTTNIVISPLVVPASRDIIKGISQIRAADPRSLCVAERNLVW